MKRLLILFFIFSLSLSAQQPGYLGKRLLLKTNVINGIHLGLKNLDIEYVTSRQLSMNFSAQYFSYKMGEDGIEKKNGVIQPRNGYCKLDELVLVKGGTTKGFIGTIGFRYYFNSVMPAPVGFYCAADLGFGAGSISGNSVSYSYKNVSDLGCTYLDEVNYPLRPSGPLPDGRFSMFYAELPAVGYQKMLSRVISVDLKAALQMQFCKISEEIVQGVDKNVFIRGNTFSMISGSSVTSPAIYVKFGFLIF